MVRGNLGRGRVKGVTLDGCFCYGYGLGLSEVGATKGDRVSGVHVTNKAHDIEGVS